MKWTDSCYSGVPINKEGGRGGVNNCATDGKTEKRGGLKCHVIHQECPVTEPYMYKYNNIYVLMNNVNRRAVGYVYVHTLCNVYSMSYV